MRLVIEVDLFPSCRKKPLKFVSHILAFMRHNDACIYFMRLKQSPCPLQLGMSYFWD